MLLVAGESCVLLALKINTLSNSRFEQNYVAAHLGHTGAEDLE